MSAVEIDPTSEPATKGELALVRAGVLAEIRNLRTWAEGRFAAIEAQFEALRQELFARIEKSEARMWKAMAAQLLAFAAIQKWL